jgi:hypothetical protein
MLARVGSDGPREWWVSQIDVRVYAPREWVSASGCGSGCPRLIERAGGNMWKILNVRIPDARAPWSAPAPRRSIGAGLQE